MKRATTFLEALRDSLIKAGRYNPNDVERPAAILWTDPDRMWSPVREPLQSLIPQLFVLGSYLPERKTGPAIWLRCVIERTLPEIDWPEESVPVIYMPGISRQVLRAVKECPDDLKPLVELQYRGVVWMQKNGRDWTVEAFLVSDDGGLGLDLAKDAATRSALQNALPELFMQPISPFQGKRLEAEDFDKLMIEDPINDLLAWLNSPKEVREAWSQGKWSAFRSRCKAEFHFDPQKDGELVGGELLGRKKQSGWAAAWKRFVESPALYPGIPELLRKSMPKEPTLFEDQPPWPQPNESMEESLRQALLKLENVPPSEARAKIMELEKKHGPRREWVWASLGKAPLALAMKPLSILAARTESNLGGTTVEDMADLYRGAAWEADMSALEGLASVKSAADRLAVQTAIRALYLPWLQSAAEHFQKLLESASFPTCTKPDPGSINPGDGAVVVFVDGLRWDVAKRLVQLVSGRGWEVQLSHRWTGLPTVTATTKPAVSPAAEKLKGQGPGEDFLPTVLETGQSLSTDRFRKLLEGMGLQVLDVDETGDPSGRAWTERGELDKLGHTLQSKLASRLEEKIELTLERIDGLIAAGWKEILIVTDHGWLLMPGGLPAVKLHKVLTESRWARCASIKGGSKVECPSVPWYWNPEHHVAVGPGISCFGNGFEYAHGGASLQECLVPVITIKGPTGGATSSAVIAEVKWTGLRCRVKVEPPEKGLRIDLRSKVNDPVSSITEPKNQPKPLNDEGVASLFISDEDLTGTSCVVVLLDGSENVIHKVSTIVGGEE